MLSHIIIVGWYNHDIYIISEYSVYSTCKRNKRTSFTHAPLFHVCCHAAIPEKFHTAKFFPFQNAPLKQMVHAGMKQLTSS